MFVIPVTYKDYNGVERTEKYYFNLNEAELTEMEMTAAGGFQDRMQRIIDAKDSADIFAEFKKLVLLAYGKKSDDGKRFMKSDEIKQEFIESPAYSMIIMELGRNADKALEFVNGILPEAARQHNPAKEITVSNT